MIARPLILVGMLAGCGTYEAPRTQINALPDSCQVEEIDEGAIIRCPDGSKVEVHHGVNGVDGMDGMDGAAGQDGIDGKDGVDGIDGVDGQDGQDGEDGIDGKDGKNAATVQPILVGHYCGRMVIKIGGIHYIDHGNITRLHNWWLKISNTCQVRVHKGQVRVKD